ncbi:MAG: hypothetical protein ACK5JO_08105 [Halodesulfovibrio sp.]
MQISGLTRHDPFEKLEDMLRKGNEVARRKLEEKGVTTQEAGHGMQAGTLPPEAADDVDLAYGAAMSLLGQGDSGGLAQHALDPDRVAALLEM